jgi:outer membrane protein TolC
MELAREVERVTRIKYQQGVGSNLEVVTAVSEYRVAENNYYTALYDALIARVDYQKATGTLGQP